jgi:hypothetical protein
MRVARAVVLGEGGRGPRLRREGWGGGFDGCWVWLGGGFGGESGAESLLGKSWAWAWARG